MDRRGGETSKKTYAATERILEIGKGRKSQSLKNFWNGLMDLSHD